MNQVFTLITGRTRSQAEGLHQGRSSESYRRATALLQMNAEDMVRLGLEVGQMARVKSGAGEVELPVEAGDLPPGMIFIPMGPAANCLVAADTEGSGMPAYKGIASEVEAI